MSIARSFTIACILVSVTPTVSADSPSASELSAHELQATQLEATNRALAFISTAGERWMDERGCVSCHQIPTMVWSHHAARQSGIEISRDKLSKWDNWSTNVVNFVKPERKEDLDHDAAMSANIDTMVAMMLAIPKQPDQSWRQKFSQKLVSEQSDDGSWNPCGQLPMQRRPKNETQAVTTLWTAYALAREAVDFRVEKAIAFADGVQDAQSTEWYAARLLVADYLNEDSTEARRQALIKLQNEDGGWGWRVDQASDALGTGYALYALAKTGSPPEELHSAREYLFRSQTESGKWIVPGTKKSAKGKPTTTANDWGTAWAIIALSTSESSR